MAKQGSNELHGLTLMPWTWDDLTIMAKKEKAKKTWKHFGSEKEKVEGELEHRPAGKGHDATTAALPNTWRTSAPLEPSCCSSLELSNRRIR